MRIQTRELAWTGRREAAHSGAWPCPAIPLSPWLRTMTTPKAKRTAPSDEEMKPPVYEQGSNIRPSFSEALDCEHLDADLYRSGQVRNGSAGWRLAEH